MSDQNQPPAAAAAARSGESASAAGPGPVPGERSRLVVLVLAGGADSLSLGDSGERTPLAEAETPTLDRIARDGTLARVVLEQSSCWEGFSALLGLDPLECALGPAEARGASIGLPDDSFVARGDLVTVDELRMLDPYGGHVRDLEADALLSVLSDNGDPFQLFRLSRERNLVVQDAPFETAEAPWQVLHRELDPSALPEGPARTLFRRSRERLVDHDVNAVRVDLGENPATALWTHGGGAALPAALDAPSWAPADATALVADGDAERGLAAALGWTYVQAPAEEGDGVGAAALAALTDHRVVIVRTDRVLRAGIAGGADARRDALSEVDARIAAPLLSALEEFGDYTFAVVVDGVFDGASSQYSAEPVPAGVLRPGGAPHGPPTFTERTCEQSGHREDGATGFAHLLDR